MTEQPLRYFSA